MYKMVVNNKAQHTREEIFRIVKNSEKKGEKIWLGKVGKKMGLKRTERSPLRYHIYKLVEDGKLEAKKESVGGFTEILVLKTKK